MHFQVNLQMIERIVMQSLIANHLALIRLFDCTRLVLEMPKIDAVRKVKPENLIANCNMKMEI